MKFCQFLAETCHRKFETNMCSLYTAYHILFNMSALYLAKTSNDFKIQCSVKHEISTYKSNCHIRQLPSSINSNTQEDCSKCRQSVLAQARSRPHSLVDYLVDDMLLHTRACSNQASLQISNVEYIRACGRQTRYCTTPQTLNSPLDSGRDYSMVTDLGQWSGVSCGPEVPQCQKRYQASPQMTKTANFYKQVITSSLCYKFIFYRATLCIARFYHRKYVRPSVCLSVCHARGLCPHGSTYDHDFFTMTLMILVFWRQISSPHSNGMTFKFKVKYNYGTQKMWFSALKQLVSRERWVIQRKLL